MMKKYYTLQEVLSGKVKTENTKKESTTGRELTTKKEIDDFMKTWKKSNSNGWGM
jgi:hypothetical protein